MGVILEEPKHKVLDPSPSLKTTGESSPPHFGRLWSTRRAPSRLPPPLLRASLPRRAFRLTPTLSGSHVNVLVPPFPQLAVTVPPPRTPRVVSNFTALDLLKAAAFTGAAVAVGYSTGETTARRRLLGRFTTRFPRVEFLTPSLALPDLLAIISSRGHQEAGGGDLRHHRRHSRVLQRVPELRGKAHGLLSKRAVSFSGYWTGINM